MLRINHTLTNLKVPAQLKYAVGVCFAVEGTGAQHRKDGNIGAPSLNRQSKLWHR